jgi:hypothetical protein
MLLARTGPPSPFASSPHAMVPRAPGAEVSRFGDSLLCTLLALYMASLLFEGVLRYVVATAGVPNALYLRDIIPVASLLFLSLRALVADRRIDLPITIAVVLLACHAAWAAVLGVSTFSIAFGLKVFMFIVYGIAMWPLLRRRFETGLTWASVMFAVAAAGVFANYFLERMPWEGMEYETAFGASSTTRLWWTGEVARLPGFARTSFNAAMILGITGLLAMVKFRPALVRVFIFATAFTAIVLTTTKGMILAFPLAALWLAVQSRRPGMDGRWFVGTLCALSLTLPLAVVLWDAGSAIKASSFPPSLLSVWDRFTSMWPLAFALLPDGPLALLGAGVGSIGTPQLFGNAPHHFNAGDSLALYLIVSFGVAGLLYCALPAVSVRKVAAAYRGDLHRVIVVLLAIAYAYGLSINMIEESFFSFFFGLCFYAAARAWHTSDEG